ncbi:DNA-directed RNA polymerase III subunit RPC6 [Nematocida sp. AWRm77]|nr:DNA-directed RNA polymerase III subunit RPC6 [Nematocida sp. AWRm77]
MSAVLSFISSHENGVTTQEIEKAFPELPLQTIVSELNTLSRSQAVDIFRTKTDILYRVPKEGHKFMSSEEKIVFLLVQESKNEGIWIKDIKTQSGLHQNLITKILKGLEQRLLIKAVKSVNQNRKVYILYDTVPSEHLGDGPWFTQNAELDVGFVDAIKNVIYNWLCASSMENRLLPFEALPECKDIHQFILSSGVSSVPLTKEDIFRIVSILVSEQKVLKLGTRYMPVKESALAQKEALSKHHHHGRMSL